MLVTALLALACGTERVDVKQLRDHPELAQERATVTSIAELRKVPRLLKWTGTAPRTATERRVAGVAAWLVGYKLEADSDFHLVIDDGRGRTMIAELPDPECATSPQVRLAFTNARRQFRALVQDEPTRKFRTLEQPIPISVAGVVFLDKVHVVIGIAPNGVELHPVTWISRRRVP